MPFRRLSNTFIDRSQEHKGLLFIMVIDSQSAKLYNLNFQPLEEVFRYRDPQPQVVEHYA